MLDGLIPLRAGTGLEIVNVPPLPSRPRADVCNADRDIAGTSQERIRNRTGQSRGRNELRRNRRSLQVICDVLLKFVPLTVSATAGEPASAPVGANPETVGATLRTFTLKLAEPPAFEIKPLSVAGFWVSAALRLKVALLPETTPVTEPNVAVVAAVKPVPCTVTVAGPDPAGTDGGFTLVIAGAALPCGLIVNVWAVVVPAPGLVTVTATGPAVARLPAGMLTVIDVPFDVRGRLLQAAEIDDRCAVEIISAQASTSGRHCPHWPVSAKC